MNGEIPMLFPYVTEKGRVDRGHATQTFSGVIGLTFVTIVKLIIGVGNVQCN